MPFVKKSNAILQACIIKCLKKGPAHATRSEELARRGGDEMAEAQKLSLRSLKALATRELQPGSPLREAILADADEIDSSSYLPRLDVWITLLNLEVKKK
jgi:hypothetical protein